MYILLYSATLFCILVITKYKYHTIIKSNILFTLVWCICSSFSSLGVYDLIKPSDIIHFYSITTIISFNIAFFIFNRNYSNNYNLEESWKNKININIIYFLNFISWIYMIRFLNKSIPIILSGGFKTLRIYAYNSNMGLGTTIELLIAQIFVEAIFNSTMIISTFDISNNREYPNLIIISIIDVIIYTVAFAGRGMLTTFIAYSVIAFVFIKFNKKGQKIKIKKNKLRTYIIIIIGATMMYFLTKARGWGEVSFIKELYLYMVGPFSFLDVLLKENIMSHDQLLYGKAIFGFIYNLISMPLAYLLKFDYKGSDYLITSVTATSRFISPDRLYNALTTMIYPFLRDFGYLGIIFGSSIFAYFVSFAERSYKEKNNIAYLYIYILLLFNLFNSVKNYYLYSPTFGMTVVVIFLFTKKIKLKKGKYNEHFS